MRLVTAQQSCGIRCLAVRLKTKATTISNFITSVVKPNLYYLFPMKPCKYYINCPETRLFYAAWEVPKWDQNLDPLAHALS